MNESIERIAKEFEFLKAKVDENNAALNNANYKIAGLQAEKALQKSEFWVGFVAIFIVGLILGSFGMFIYGKWEEKKNGVRHPQSRQYGEVSRVSKRLYG